MNAVDFDLYLVTDRNQTGGRDLLWVLEQALDGGVKAIQLREKDLSGRDLFSLAERSHKLCQAYDAALFINDRVDVAMAVDAAGVQLSKASLPIVTARALLGPQKIIGVSTHSLQETKEAEQDGADFVLFGPVYFTPSKAAYGAPQGLPALKTIVDNISLTRLCYRRHQAGEYRVHQEARCSRRCIDLRHRERGESKGGG